MWERRRFRFQQAAWRASDAAPGPRAGDHGLKRRDPSRVFRRQPIDAVILDRGCRRRTAPLSSQGSSKPSSSGRFKTRRRASLDPNTSSTNSASIRSKTARSSKSLRTAVGTLRSRCPSTYSDESLAASTLARRALPIPTRRQSISPRGHPAVRRRTSASWRCDSSPPKNLAISGPEKRNCSVRIMRPEPSNTCVAKSNMGRD